MQENELLKKINGKLIEINSKLDKPTFHISGGSKNIGQQNNFYSLSKIKPLLLKKNKKIEIVARKIYLRKNDIVNLFFSILIASLILPLFIHFIFSIMNIQFNISPSLLFSYLISVLFLFLFMYPVILSLLFILQEYSKKIIVLNNTCIFVEIKELEYENVRSILKVKEPLGYSIFIYKTDEINPFFSFNLKTIHQANSIEELILNKINS